MQQNGSGSDGRNRLLSSLSPADYSLLVPNLKNFNLVLGDVLQEAGDPFEQVYFPLDGMISLLAIMQNGTSVETATIGHEGAAGAGSGLGSRTSPYRAVVQIKGAAARIGTESFQKAVTESVSLRDLVVRYTDHLMMMVQQSAGCNALHVLEARLCRWLLQTRDRSDSDVLPLTQEFLSQMLGVRRTTLTVIASNLQKTGMIRYRRGKIEIVNRAALEAKACECYEVVRRGGEEVLLHAKT
jgi:CRP-like cAMP-binding protein